MGHRLLYINFFFRNVNNRLHGFFFALTGQKEISICYVRVREISSRISQDKEPDI